MRKRHKKRDYLHIYSDIIDNSLNEIHISTLFQKANVSRGAYPWIELLVHAGMLEERVNVNDKRRYPARTFTSTSKGREFSFQVKKLEFIVSQ